MRRSYMRIQRFCSSLFLAIVLSSVAFGQGVATGDLHVSVKDPQGEEVPNATVVARDRAKGTERVASANGVGQYSLLALPPASRMGHATWHGSRHVPLAALSRDCTGCTSSDGARSCAARPASSRTRRTPLFPEKAPPASKSVRPR